MGYSGNYSVFAVCMAALVPGLKTGAIQTRSINGALLIFTKPYH